MTRGHHHHVLARGGGHGWRHGGGHGWRHGRTLRGALLGSFIAAVVVTGFIVSAFFFFGSERGSWTDEVARVGAYAADGVDEATARGADARPFLEHTARHFATRLVLKEGDVVVAEAGPGQCRHPIVVDMHHGRSLEACRPQLHGPPLRGLLSVGVVVAVLALLSSAVARRISWPLRSLAETARQIGAGDLSARPHLGPHPFVEVRLVGEALADMAGRIERELSGQRALLAGASHELRTPLGHVRILVETARMQQEQGRFDGHLLDEIDKEVQELDSLLEKLLAQARLDFVRIDRRPVDLVEVTRRALQRANVDVAVLQAWSVPGAPGAELQHAPLVQGDATLLARAIGNLLENAATHGGGVARVAFQPSTSAGGRAEVRIVVDDDGAGVDVKDRERIFEPFVHQSDRGAGALGLGLHLVRRIAEAHGGRVAVEDRGAGARFVLTLPA